MSQKEDETTKREHELARQKAILDIEEPMKQGKLNIDFLKAGSASTIGHKAISITRFKKPKK